MPIKRTEKNYYDIRYDWIDLENLAEERSNKTQTYMVTLGKVAVPAAIFYFDDINYSYADIYLPGRVDLSVPVPGRERVIAVVDPSNFVPDIMGRSIQEE